MNVANRKLKPPVARSNKQKRSDSEGTTRGIYNYTTMVVCSMNETAINQESDIGPFEGTTSKEGVVKERETKRGAGENDGK
jgi:hypothetical protein